MNLVQAKEIRDKAFEEGYQEGYKQCQADIEVAEMFRSKSKQI